MALFRSVRSNANNTFRKLSRSNLKSLSKQSQSLRSSHHRASLSPFIRRTSCTKSAYKFLSSTYRPVGRINVLPHRPYGGHQYMSPYQMYPAIYPNHSPPEVHATTIICVRKGDQVVLVGDGQMTIGNVVAKSNGRKLRKLNNKKAVCGFAGSHTLSLSHSLIHSFSLWV